jgi:ribosomal protein RSM22 (predicted rRNA methylase)
MMDIHERDLPDEADLVISSYLLNEMTDEQQIEAAVRFFHAAREMLLLVEPGTPKGYTVLQRVRNKLLESGAHIIAPCLHEGKCHMIGDDWCHFSCRIPRSRLHRQAKGGEAPYEDEKFTYLAVARNACQYASARILRHPRIYKGYLELEVCTKDGIRKIKLSKKDGERYRQAKKAKIGDTI